MADEQIEVKYFATLNANGLPTGFYPSDVWPEDKRPAEAVEITTEQYVALIEAPGSTLVDGAVVPPPDPTPVNNIVTVPETLVGGPTIKEVFNVNN